MDDGLATGVTARAACAAIRAAGAARVVLAVPVGSAHTVSELQQEGVADVVVCLRTPQRFRAVGAHYLVSKWCGYEQAASVVHREGMGWFSGAAMSVDTDARLPGCQVASQDPLTSNLVLLSKCACCRASTQATICSFLQGWTEETR